MKKNGILAGTVRLFSGINAVLARAAGYDQVGFGQTDFAILKVAMMVSALDGDVTADELAAFERMAKKCVGYTPEEAEKALHEGFRSAGYLQLLAKVSGERKLIDEFVNEAFAALPKGFAFERVETVRQALVTWVSMAMSDGEYSGIERKAIATLVQKLGDDVGRLDADGCAIWASLSPTHAVMQAGERATRLTPTSTKAFLDKVERLLGQLDEASPLAAKELKNLVLNG